jgi:hypothetical protein
MSLDAVDNGEDELLKKRVEEMGLLLVLVELDSDLVPAVNRGQAHTILDRRLKSVASFLSCSGVGVCVRSRANSAACASVNSPCRSNVANNVLSSIISSSIAEVQGTMSSESCSGV